MKIIETVHLTKNYGQTLALKNVNLLLEEGEIYGLVGPTGAGKSTLIKLLLNFIFPNIGHATIFELNCAKKSAKIKEKVGYVPSDVHYSPDATAGELLKTTLAFHRIQSEKAIWPLCEGLEIEMIKPFGVLSISDQKKIAIACAMVHEPRLLILDDPGKGLDPTAKRQVFELLREANQKGTSIFLASNSLAEIQDYCTRVALLKEGRVIRVEDLTKVRKKVKIVELWGEAFDFRDLEILGGRMLNVTEKSVKFSYEGDVEKLLKTLSMMTLKDVAIKNASLEDEFLDYYEGGHGSDTLEIGI
nr:ABC transporter ATP-binding protein [uncultured Acetobacterium sp.]